MSELENTVEMMTADDAQGTDGQVVTMDDLMDALTDTDAAAETNETADNTGDSGQETKRRANGEDGESKDKFGRRIASALANQKRGFQKDLDFSAMVRGASGDMTDAEIAEALRDYQARKIADSDKEISPKAARQIVEAREKARGATGESARSEADMRAELQRMMDEDGWTLDELKAFSQDEQVKAAIDEGASLRRAAKAYLQRQIAPQTQRRRSVPTSRSAGTSDAPHESAIDRMSDEEFERFAEKAHRAAMSGKRVRI